MGAGRAIASPYQRGFGGEPATPPSPCPPPAPAHHGLGASGCSPGPPTGAPRQDAEWLQGQPWAAKLLQHPCPPKGQPQALKGMGGQGRVVRMVVAANLLLPLPAARPPQPRVAGSAQPPRRAPTKPSTWPHVIGPAASLTTRKVAVSCPLHACSSSCSSRWRCCMPLPHLSPGAATPPRRAPSPGPSRWRAPPTSLLGALAREHHPAPAGPTSTGLGAYDRPHLTGRGGLSPCSSSLSSSTSCSTVGTPPPSSRPSSSSWHCVGGSGAHEHTYPCHRWGVCS